MRAQWVSVYRNSRYEGCSNGGISEKYDELLLVCDDGTVEVDTENPPENLVKMVTKIIVGKECKSIEPVAEVPPGMIGYMSGGAVAYSSDNRFRFDYPILIHDRCETVRQYDMLSR